MKALVFENSLPRYAAAAVASRASRGIGGRVGPLRLKDIDPPELPSEDWVQVRPRLAGICGSDLASIDGRSSRFFEPIVSFPFVMGHEVVGDLDDDTRVVVEPVLGCATRAIQPPCPACSRGDLGNCEQIAFGDLEPGLQTGFCCDTGGGWAAAFAAHRSQIHEVPGDFDDEAAVMVEPTACAVHGALAGKVQSNEVAVIVGSGALGLLTAAALAEWTPPAQMIVAAKHPEQRRLAQELGAARVAKPSELTRVVRSATRCMALETTRGLRLTGGADVVFDCVGSGESLQHSLDVVRPRGRVVILGMPGTTTLDLTGLWQREVEVRGAYTYGTEHVDSGPRRTFDMAFDLVRERDLGRLVTKTYPLERYEDAILHASEAGVRGAVKIAFDLRNDRERNRL